MVLKPGMVSDCETHLKSKQIVAGYSCAVCATTALEGTSAMPVFTGAHRMRSYGKTVAYFSIQEHLPAVEASQLWGFHVSAILAFPHSMTLQGP